MACASKYGLRYTGMVTEVYDSATDGSFKKSPDTALLQYFGNMRLHLNGEIGFYGYSHQSLVLGTPNDSGNLPDRA